MTPTSFSLTSVVIPVFNEQESLPELLERTDKACRQLSMPFEIIFVDDGSRDDSVALLKAAADREGSAIRVVVLNRNYGQHAAIMAGFEASRGDFVITLDADLQNPPEEIPRLVEAGLAGYDVVATVRRNRQDSFFRRWSSRLINGAVRKATGVMMTDYGCMLRGYHRRIIDAMLQCHERSTFIPILANSFARNTIEFEVDHAEREHGESRYSFMRLISLMFDLVTCMTTQPLRLASLAGAAIAGVGFVFALLLIVLRIALGAAWGLNGVFPLFAILFIFIGVQMIGIGLVGEYLGRMYNDVRARPRYFVEATYESAVLRSSAAVTPTFSDAPAEDASTSTISKDAGDCTQ